MHWKAHNYIQKDRYKPSVYTEEKNKVEKEETDNKLDGLTFVLTGKSSIGSRDKVKALIESNGGKVVGSVSSKTNYLLSNAVEDTTKYNTAKRLEIPIITDKDLLGMI